MREVGSSVCENILAKVISFFKGRKICHCWKIQWVSKFVRKCEAWSHTSCPYSLFCHNIPKDTTNAVIWRMQHNSDDRWYNFTIRVALLFVLDSLMCCSCALKYPKKFCFVLYDSWWFVTTFVSLWFFDKNSSSLVKSLLNFLMLFSHYSCFWKNRAFLYYKSL